VHDLIWIGNFLVPRDVALAALAIPLAIYVTVLAFWTKK
jgi:hypothetical protein